jgi:pyruvate/2-oxoglutarate dehydrogenase complex dihydrolipoamide dehydrogenase (E3) component
MPPPQHYDAIVIGSGPVAESASEALAWPVRAHRSIEKVHVGGTCINEGCTPPKLWSPAAASPISARRGPYYGVHTGTCASPWIVSASASAIVNLFRSGSERRIAPN